VSKEENEHSGEKEDGIEVLMVSSPNRDDLVFPKVHSLSSLLYCCLHEIMLSYILNVALLCCQGGWEDDETKEEAACREAFEEAGVKGKLKVGSLN